MAENNTLKILSVSLLNELAVTYAPFPVSPNRIKNAIRTPDEILNDNLSILSEVSLEVEENGVNKYYSKKLNFGELISQIYSTFNSLNNDLITKDANLSAGIQKLSTSLSNDIKRLSTSLSNDIKRLSTNLSTDISSLSTNLSNDIKRLSTSLSTDITNLKNNLTTSINSLTNTENRHYNDLTTSINNKYNEFKLSANKFKSDIEYLSGQIAIINDRLNGYDNRYLIKASSYSNLQIVYGPVAFSNTIIGTVQTALTANQAKWA